MPEMHKCNRKWDDDFDGWMIGEEEQLDWLINQEYEDISCTGCLLQKMIFSMLPCHGIGETFERTLEIGYREMKKLADLPLFKDVQEHYSLDKDIDDWKTGAYL